MVITLTTQNILNTKIILKMNNFINLIIKLARTFFLVPMIIITLINKSIARTLTDIKDVTTSQVQETMQPLMSFVLYVIAKLKKSFVYN